MNATYWQRGETLDYKNDTARTIPENTMIPIEGRVGVTGTAIEPGKTGSLHVAGVFETVKKEGEEIKMGENLFFEESGVTKAETGVTAGYAAASSGADKKTVMIKLLG